MYPATNKILDVPLDCTQMTAVFLTVQVGGTVQKGFSTTIWAVMFNYQGLSLTSTLPLNLALV